jgi:elongation factor G
MESGTGVERRIRDPHIGITRTSTARRRSPSAFTSGRTHRMGEVHDGLAVMDSMELERERGITITSAVTSFEWRGHEVHLIDTPGHVDFTLEVERSLRVLDGAVAVFDAAHGVEPQSETVWRQADHYRVPRIAFANKMDRVGADLAMTVASMRRRFPDQVIAPVQRPIGAEAAFQGFEDLVARRTVRFAGSDDPRAFTESEGISPEGEEERQALIERLADVDDAMADALLGDEAVDEAALRAALRRATLTGRFVPVLCGSALRNKGVPQMLDAVCDYLPSPLDVPPVRGEDPRTGEEVVRSADEAAPVVALAFKVSLLDEKRRHVFLRVYSGRIAEGDTVWNANLRKHEKVSRVLLMHAAQKKSVPSLGAGQIFAVTGLKEARTGDTLSDPGHPVVLERLSAYEPVISQAIEAASLSDRDALLEALARVADEDPSFRFGEDPDTGQLLVSGMGELHLEVYVERLRREFGLAVRTGQPQVLMRETLTATAEASAAFERRRTSSTSSVRWRSAWARSHAAAGSASAWIRLRRRSRSSRPRCGARWSRARARRPRPACSRATRCRTWRWCSPAPPGAKGARSRWRTRSPPPTRCARPPPARGRCCSSRSCAWRSSRRASTSARSSGASISARGRSRGRRSRRGGEGNPERGAAATHVRLRDRAPLAHAGPGGVHDAVRSLRCGELSGARPRPASHHRAREPTPVMLPQRMGEEPDEQRREKRHDDGGGERRHRADRDEERHRDGMREEVEGGLDAPPHRDRRWGNCSDLCRDG